MTVLAIPPILLVYGGILTGELGLGIPTHFQCAYRLYSHLYHEGHRPKRNFPINL